MLVPYYYYNDNDNDSNSNSNNNSDISYNNKKPYEYHQLVFESLY